MRNKFIITEETPIQVTGVPAPWKGTWGEFVKNVAYAPNIPAILKALSTKGKYDAGIVVELGKIHKFEAAGLGKAPFRFVGMNVNTFQACPGAPIKAGGCCDYCYTGIMYEFHIVSADGKRSKVGCDCIAKVGDNGLKVAVERSPEYLKWQEEVKQAKIKKTLEDLKAIMEGHIEAMRALPHPMGFTDRVTGKAMTLADYAVWMEKNCGHSGRHSLVKTLKKQLNLG